MILKQLTKLQDGFIDIQDNGQHFLFGKAHSRLQGQIEIQSPAFWSAVATQGSIGAGESYIHGHWSSPDLTAIMRILIRNLDVLDGMESGLASLGRPGLRLLHWLNRNSRRGAKRNVTAHYDLGNDLFETFLDPTLMYSSAMFLSPADSLEQAQIRKMDRICQKLALGPHDHLLEIGTGWGSLAIYAAHQYGCRVTTTTLSPKQHQYAIQRVREAGLEGRITVLLKDYRDLAGSYDKLVSVEMIEAVGQKFLSDYFRQCQQLLKAEGLMLLQAITIREQRYHHTVNNVDFIQRYIFPGGSLPSIEKLIAISGTSTDMNVTHLEEFGVHYARTLHDWLQRFKQATTSLRHRGYDSEFQRMWEFYLCYCEGGFLERAIGVVQILFARSAARPAPLLAPLATTSLLSTSDPDDIATCPSCSGSSIAAKSL